MQGRSPAVRASLRSRLNPGRLRSVVALHPELLAHAVGTLSPSDHLLVTLRFEDGLSAPEIARVMHLPTSFHVYRRLDAAIRALRANLVARGVESPTP